MFLSDVANFATPLPPLADKWGKRVATVGNNHLGKVFLKDAKVVQHYDKFGKLLKNTNGIAASGKTIRKTPLALAGLGVAGYGAYRAKKTYDKYKPEIETGRKLMRKYNQFKNMFNKEGN